MPPPLSETERSEEPLDVIPALALWVRGALLAIIAGLVMVFVIALRLDPYYRETPEDHPEFVAALAPAPEAGFPANLPWAALALSASAEVQPPTPRRMETHRQLGMPPCTFFLMTRMPCPSCGMTTSFSLLAHGDVWNSLRANAVGTLLATVCLAFIPWALACVVCNRPFFILSMERVLVSLIVVFLTLMLVRWAIVLAGFWWSRL